MSSALLQPSVITVPAPVSPPLSPTGVPGIFVEHRCQACTDLWYYDHEIEMSHPPGVYAHIIGSAARRVWVWDPYLLKGDAALFRTVKPGVTLWILTFKGIDPKKTIPSGLAIVATELSNAFAGTGVNVEFRCYNTFLDPAPEDPFHDRYLFIDDEVYMVGASLKQQYTRTTSTSLLMVTSESAKLLLRNRFEACWKHKYKEIIL